MKRGEEDRSSNKVLGNMAKLYFESSLKTDLLHIPWAV